MEKNSNLFEFSEKDDNNNQKSKDVSLKLDYSALKDKKKSLGQNFTSQVIVDFMISLSLVNKNAKILEPSAGEGIFIKRLKDKGFSNIEGYEIDPSLCQDKEDIINKDFLTTKQTVDYDLIIGNPPYVRWKHMPKELQTFFSESVFWKTRINALSDLLQTFIFKSVDLLKEGGELIFITPYFWLQSLHASRLREFLSINGYIDKLIHFGEHKLFNDAASNFIIFRYIKTTENKNKKIKFVELTDKKSDLINNIDKIKSAINQLDTQNIIEYDNIKSFCIDQFNTSNSWDLINPETNGLLSKYENNSGFKKSIINGNDTFTYEKGSKEYLKFSDICKIGAGMVSGLDKAFKLKNEEISKFNEEEQKKVIYFVKSRDMDRFFYVNKTPYLRVDDCKSEEELKEKYLNIYTHLHSFKDDLEKRYDYGVKWYQYSFLRNLDLFLNNPGEKLFVPSKDRKPYSRFIYVNKPYFCGQDACAIVIKEDIKIKENIKYILALLNSEVINQWYRHKGIKRGDVLQYSFEPMSKIPIRLIDWDDDDEVKIYNEIIRLIDEVIEMKKYNEHVSKINEYVKKLYLK
jgi:adenine-specific DNA-methyltransferase